MDKYEVQYQTNAWYNNSQWGYVSDGAHQFYQTQYERYWDYSNYPYRFYAISPCPPYSEIGNFVLTDKQLTLPETARFQYQTCTDGLLSQGAEPYMPAQVSRNPEGKDHDLMATNDDNSYPKEINIGSSTLNRHVALPFHHFTSKVRFAFYCQDLGEQDYDATLKVSDVEVKVISPSFTTEANGYSTTLSATPSATSTGTMISGDFTQRTTGTDVTLLTMTTDGDATNNMRRAIDRKTAYWTKCKTGMLQIPQKGVQMQISFKVHGKMMDNVIIDAYHGQIVYDEETNTTSYNNLLITIDDGLTDTFEWEENTIYTYYIVVSRYFLHGITFTATLTPWEDVNGSLSTDLEQ